MMNSMCVAQHCTKMIKLSQLIHVREDEKLFTILALQYNVNVKYIYQL